MTPLKTLPSHEIIIHLFDQKSVNKFGSTRNQWNVSFVKNENSGRDTNRVLYKEVEVWVLEHAWGRRKSDSPIGNYYIFFDSYKQRLFAIITMVSDAVSWRHSKVFSSEIKTVVSTKWSLTATYSTQSSHGLVRTEKFWISHREIMTSTARFWNGIIESLWISNALMPQRWCTL